MSGKKVLLTGDTLLEDLRDLLVKAPQSLPEITGVSIDTRTLSPGDLFIALQGETDADPYASEAFHRGAAAVVVQKPRDALEGPVFQVRSTFEALQALGCGARTRAVKAQVFAVTGSVGKTGTKEALRHVLKVYGNVHASASSFNNHWGVPLSLARMPSSSEYGVFELGMNHPGELGPLSRMVQPHVALITRIGLAHKAHFENTTAIARAKAEIFEGLLPGGVAVLNRDDPHFEDLLLSLHTSGHKNVISFGAHPQADIRLLNAEVTQEGSHWVVSSFGTRHEGFLGSPGAHGLGNALGVLGVLVASGLEVSPGFQVLETLKPLPGRGEKRLLTTKNGKTVTLLDETYNANPTSMAAALSLLPLYKGVRRLVVLGDMRELGEEEAKDHRELFPLLDSADLVFLCGPLMAELNPLLPPQKYGGWASCAEELAPLVASCLQNGDLLMVKASRGMGLERLIHALS